MQYLKLTLLKVVESLKKILKSLLAFCLFIQHQIMISLGLSLHLQHKVMFHLYFFCNQTLNTKHCYIRPEEDFPSKGILKIANVYSVKGIGLESFIQKSLGYKYITFVILITV